MGRKYVVKVSVFLVSGLFGYEVFLALRGGESLLKKYMDEFMGWLEKNH